MSVAPWVPGHCAEVVARCGPGVSHKVAVAKWHDRPHEPAFSFHPLAGADFALLGSWLAQPHVARWWNHESSPQAMEADFGAVVDRLDPADVFIVSHDARPVGLLQRYTFADNPGYIAELGHPVDAPGAALSIDYFLGEPIRPAAASAAR